MTPTLAKFICPTAKNSKYRGMLEDDDSPWITCFDNAIGCWIEILWDDHRGPETVFISFFEGQELPGIPRELVYLDHDDARHMLWSGEFSAGFNSSTFLRYVGPYHGKASELERMLDEEDGCACGWRIGVTLPGGNSFSRDTTQSLIPDNL